jgi:hypothetical protein
VIVAFIKELSQRQKKRQKNKNTDLEHLCDRLYKLCLRILDGKRDRKRGTEKAEESMNSMNGSKVMETEKKFMFIKKKKLRL